MSTPAPIVLDGGPLTIDDVASVASGRRPVALAPEARERMAVARKAVEEILAGGQEVYGLTTGVGALKRVQVADEDQEQFNRRMIASHVIGHGDAAPHDVVRAAMVVRVQGLALGHAGVRPLVADAYLDALARDLRPRVHSVASVGVADLGPMAEIAQAVLADGLRLQAKEALSLINSNAFGLGWACLALVRAHRAVEVLEEAAALTYEGLLANPAALDPEVARARPHAGLGIALSRLRDLLGGGTLLGGGLVRNLQEPLSVRGVAQVSGAAREALGHATAQVETELRSSGDNPLLIPGECRAISCANFDVGGVAAALDYARIAFAQAITISAERAQKLVSPAHSGLPAGLRSSDDDPGDGLNIVPYGAAAAAAEARLLAQPTSLEQPTTSIAEGIEDRFTLLPVGARRLDAMAALALRVAAVELLCAAQAVDLRARRSELGNGTGTTYDLTRAHIAFTGPDDGAPTGLDELCTALAQG